MGETHVSMARLQLEKRIVLTGEEGPFGDCVCKTVHINNVSAQFVMFPMLPLPISLILISSDSASASYAALAFNTEVWESAVGMRGKKIHKLHAINVMALLPRYFIIFPEGFAQILNRSG